MALVREGKEEEAGKKDVSKGRERRRRPRRKRNRSRGRDVSKGGEKRRRKEKGTLVSFVDTRHNTETPPLIRFRCVVCDCAFACSPFVNTTGVNPNPRVRITHTLRPLTHVRMSLYIYNHGA